MKRLRHAISLIPLLLAALLMFATPGTSFGQAATPPASPAASPAAKPPTFGVTPPDGTDLSPFRLKIAAGASVDTTLTVSNDGKAPVELRTFALAVTTAVNGGYRVLPEGDKGSHGQAGWLSLSDKPYTLAPGEQIDRPVTIAVPAGTQAGEYMAALATETTESTPVSGSGTFRQITRKVNAVVITVPGPVKAGFEVGMPAVVSSNDTTTISAPITNTGNARVHPQGTITIGSTKDHKVITLPISLGSVYAWDATTIQQTLNQALPPGEYTVEINLKDKATGAEAHWSGTIVIVAASATTAGTSGA